jgi:hypothetical protein
MADDRNSIPPPPHRPSRRYLLLQCGDGVHVIRESKKKFS